MAGMQQGAADLSDKIKHIIVRATHHDIAQVLSVMSVSLAEIELSFHDDNKLQHSVSKWRDWLGRWRNTIYRQERVLRLVRMHLNFEGGRQDTKDLLDALESELRATRLRIDSTFQSLMSAMSIVESERAIQQAEGVSKLTQLAFFFIPLSLVAAVFGMNVTVSRPLRRLFTSPLPNCKQEFTNALTWRVWVITSIAVMAATYLILYRKEVLLQTVHIFRLITSQKSKGLRKLAVLKIQSNRLAFFFGAVAVLALVGIGTWRLAISGLSSGARVAIAVCIVWAPVISCILVLYYAWVPSMGLHGALRRRRRPLTSF